MKRRSISAVAVGAALALSALSGSVSLAHHSLASVYDDTHKVTLEGKITRVQFANPHPVLMIEVKEKSGKSQNWRLELDNRWELAQIGFNSETLRPGDHIVIVGDLARTLPRSVYVRRIDRPADGFKYEHHPTP